MIGWLVSRLRRRRPAVPPAPVTSAEEHAAARRRAGDLERNAERLERLIDDYRQMGGVWDKR